MAELYKGAAKRIETQLGESRNSKVLASFVAYCQAHPEERFWQALRNWSKVGFIWVSIGKAKMNDFWVGFLTGLLTGGFLMYEALRLIRRP